MAHVTEKTKADPILATVPYKPMGGSQHLTLIRHKGSVRQPGPLLTDWTELPRTVLSQAFFGRPAQIETGLPEPHSLLRLPPLTRAQLNLKLASDPQGRTLGYVARVPGLWVHANRILQRIPGYDVELAICQMVREAAYMMASVLQHGVLRVREKPGIMAHALELPELKSDEIGISFAFAEKIVAMMQKQGIPISLDTPWDLDGFPVYVVRFPIANRHGVQEMVLRVLEGHGRYLGINPWNLGKRYLGDRDGDCLFALLRVTEATFGAISRRRRVELDPTLTLRESPLSLQSVLDPSLLAPWGKGLAEKFVAPDFSTRAARLQWVEDADTRGWVAVFTMALHWWVARTLMMEGWGTQQSYEAAADLLEHFMEKCMDGRKGNSLATQIDGYRLMDTLMNGAEAAGDIDFTALEQIGVPTEQLNTLRLAWLVSNKNLRAMCRRSPIYDALILRRNSLEKATTQMLFRLKEHGVQPDTLYHTIIADLTGRRILDLGGEEEGLAPTGTGSTPYTDTVVANRSGDHGH